MVEEKATTKKKRSKQIVDRSISEEFGPYADLYKEYKEAEKRGETGISLEKELFALEDAMEFPEAFDKKAKKRYERLRELEDKGFINYVAKGHFTEHPFSAISPEYELKFLATVADNPKLSEKSYAIDRYNAFQKKIIDNSIDWYFDEPKSEAAKKWKSEREKAIQKVENTLGKRFEDLNKDYIEERSQLFDKYEDKPYEELRKKLDQVDNIFNQRGLAKFVKNIEKQKDWYKANTKIS